MKKKRGMKILAGFLAMVLTFGAFQPVFAAQAETEVSAEEVPAPDIDLTTLDPNSMIAEAAAMVANPEEYIGKTVRLAGVLQAFEYNDRYILTAFMGGASPCCGTSLEFNRAGDFTYPEDYPAVGSVVFVEGTFETYEEDGATFCWVNDAIVSTEKFES